MKLCIRLAEFVFAFFRKKHLGDDMRAQMIGILMLFAVASIGCSRENRDVGERLNNTIKYVERDVSQGPSHSILHFMNVELLTALKKVPTNALNKPILVTAGTVEQDNKVTFLLFWIEKRPTPDGVKIFSPSSGKSIVLEIPPEYRRENNEESASLIRYRVVFGWDKSDPIATFLQSHGQLGDIQVKLLLQGKDISNAVAIQQTN